MSRLFVIWNDLALLELVKQSLSKLDVVGGVVRFDDLFAECLLARVLEITIKIYGAPYLVEHDFVFIFAIRVHFGAKISNCGLTSPNDSLDVLMVKIFFGFELCESLLSIVDCEVNLDLTHLGDLTALANEALLPLAELDPSFLIVFLVGATHVSKTFAVTRYQL